MQEKIITQKLESYYYWMDYNTDASKSKMNPAMAISYVSKDYTERVIKKEGRPIGSLPVIMAKTLAIWSALKHAI